MGRRTRAVLLLLALAACGCDTNVDSPFTGVSAGGTGGPTPSQTSGEGSSSGGASTKGDTATEGSSDASNASTSTDETTDAATTEPDPTAAATTGDPCVPDPCVAPEVCTDGVCVATAAPAPGDLVITEFQPNPDMVSDDAGEWFELLNTSTNTLDLDGCELSDEGSDNHTIAGPVEVEPGAYAVFGRAAAGNGGIAPDYVYGNDISLGNSGDELALHCDGILIDDVVYLGSWPFGTGSAAQLDPSAGAANDDEALWCEAAAAYGDGDRGTPGSANAPC